MADKSVIEVAKSQLVTYNKKDWPAVKESLAANIDYDEVGTQRRIQGLDDVLVAWKGWATALPDSNASFGKETVSGNTAVIELTWRGTHNGPLPLPDRTLAPTGKKIELRACQVIEVSGAKVQTIRHYFDMATLLHQLGVM